ncbi:MAG: phytoene/squalene synthase family protein [Opitutales bacterium]|nr:phytoene/squalene synthase family protein [Opitutales bacterium]MCH8540213.1 phytoene/squalene synthase family protein [Opitutales bacterium]
MLSPAVRAKIPAFWPLPNPEPGWSRRQDLRPSLDFCQEVTRRHAKSFYFSSFPLPRDRRKGAFAIYAFCRYVDDLLDETPPDEKAGKQFLPLLQDELEKIENGQSTLPFAPAFAETTRQYKIPRQFYLDLIEGCCWDEMDIEIEDFPQLELYCYHVASVVGLIMSRVFGLNSSDGAHRAVEMGIAMQLTNILRDIAEDLDRNRIYLPRTELAAAGLDRSFLEKGTVTPLWRDFMRQQIARARAYYASGEKGIPLLAKGGARYTTRLMSRIYGDILSEIEKNDYNVFQGRVFVSTPRKCQIALRTLFH